MRAQGFSVKQKYFLRHGYKAMKIYQNISLNMYHMIYIYINKSKITTNTFFIASNLQTNRRLTQMNFLFLNENKENIWPSIKILLNFVHRGPIDDIPTLFQTRRQAVIWTNNGLVYWRICESRNLNEFKLAFQKVKWHTGGKWLIVGPKHRKDN